MPILAIAAVLSALAVIAAYLTEWGPFSIYHPEDMPLQTPPEPQNTPTNDVQPANDNSPVPTVPESEALEWDTPGHAYHAVRVMCDDAGLTYDQKNVVCACIYQESQFYNTAKHENKNIAGTTLSTDWGICQINDYYHIGASLDFPSVQYVVEHPDQAVQFMISMFKAGKLSLWSSYKSGAYRQWLVPNSPMWELAS